MILNWKHKYINKINKRLRSAGAFSLTEILVTVAIFAVALGSIYGVLQTGKNANSVYDSNVSVQQEIRKALSLMTKELRQTEDVNVTIGTGTASVNFMRTDFGNITYSWADSGDDANKIIRTFGGNDTVVAQNISELSFTDNTDSITINITVTKATGVAGTNSNISLTEKIALRG